MPTYKPITLKMSTAPAYGYTSIKQMDVEGVELILTLKNTDDSDYNLTSGSTLFFKMANESGNVKVTLSEMDSPSNITRDGANVVRVLLTESMVSETGIMACELQEMYSGTFTSSQLFYLRVWPTTADGEIIDSHEYKSLVSAYLAIDNALSVATLAKNYSESTITEENARQAAELLRIQAENDRVLAESARVAAENLRGVEVANARGGHATLGDRLDEMDVGIEGNTSEVENTKLKVIRLEQEVKRYKELYEQSNPTQSPRVSSVGYGVVSLPKNAANGQISGVELRGNTLTNYYNHANLSFDSGNTLSQKLETGFKLVKQSSSIRHARDALTNLKAGTYTLVCYVKENTTVSHNLLQVIYQDSSSAYFQIFGGGYVGYYKQALTFNKDVRQIRFYIHADEEDGVGYTLENILFLEGDWTNKEVPASYITGTKSTVGAMRLKSVGKNLFDGEVELGTIFGSTGEPVSSSASVRTKNFVPVKPNTAYRLSNDKGYSTENAYAYDYNKNYIGTFNGNAPFTTGATTHYIKWRTRGAPWNEKDLTIKFQLEEGTVVTPYEPYTESNIYIPNVGELRSLPNGTKDEIRVSEGKAIIRTKKTTLNGSENWSYVLTKENTIRFRLNISDIMPTSPPSAINHSNDVIPSITHNAIIGSDLEGLGVHNNTKEINILINKTRLSTLDIAGFKLWLQNNPITLIYQLAEPVEIPIQTSGSLVSYPSGTVYIEPFVADAGIYTDKMSVLHQDLPIKAIEKLSKVDFITGLETELDVSETVIAGDKLSFTHPDLEAGDIVFFVYEYDRESTVGETEIEYYDSRYVIKDSVTGKFYKWHIAVAGGVPSIELVEV